MLLVFTGNGKGKTTAALGQALRSVGEGKRVLMIQFIKGPWRSGEDDAEVIQGSPSNSSGPSSGVFELRKMGRGFVGILGDTLPREEHERAAREALEFAKSEMRSGIWDMIILDEVNNAVSLNLISQESVLDFLSLTPNTLHLILTGRDAPQELIAAADLVTEMRDVKHPYEKGIKAKRGLEY